MASAPTVEKQKSWFARHKILTALLVLVVIGFLATAFGGGDDSAAETRTTAPAVDAGADDGAAEAENAVEEEPAEDGAAEEPADESAPSAGIGSTVNTGNFDVTVHGVEASVAAVGSEYLNAEPSGQFVLVRVTVLNTSNEAEYFFDSDQVLVDEQGRKHSTSSDSIYLDDNTFSFEKINPGVSMDGVLLFDIPADASPVALELDSDEFFGDPIVVSLN